MSHNPSDSQAGSKSTDADGSADVQIRCFGTISATVDGKNVRLSNSQKMAIAVLVTAGRSGLTTEQLLDNLYQAPPKSGTQAAIMVMSRLRQKLPERAITIGGHYAIADCVAVDVWRFDEAVSDSPGEAVQLWDEPFGGLNDLPQPLKVESARLHQLHRTALEAAGWQAEAGSADRVLSELRAQLVTHPCDEALAAAAAVAAYRLGRQAEGLSIARSCFSSLRDSGLYPGDELRRIECAILNHQHDVLGLRADERHVIADPELPPAFVDPPTTLVGRDNAVQLLATAIEYIDESVSEQSVVGMSSRIIIVRGESGAGKTATVATALRRVADNGTRLRIGLTDGGDVAFGAITCAFPELEPDVSDGNPEDIARATLGMIRAIAADTPLVLILEDAHDADAQTLSVLRNIMPSSLPSNVLTIITTQPAHVAGEWCTLLDYLDTTGETVVDLEPLTRSEVEALVETDHPSELPIRRAHFAERVHSMSAGNGHIASILSRDAPPGLNANLLPESISPVAHLGAHLRTKFDDPELEDLLTSAALIGAQFSEDLLAHVVGRSSESTIALLDQCESLDACQRLGDGLWKFDHLLTVNHFSSRLPLLRPLVFSRIARHERAPIESMVRYVTGAGDNLPADFAFDALLRSGRERAKALAFEDALLALTQALGLAHEVGGDVLDLRLELAGYASRCGALDLAREHRSAAFALAEADDDHDSMARAALAGLPSGEFAGGEPDRLEMLKRIDTSRVESFTPEALACTWLRQSRLATKSVSIQDLLRQADLMLKVDEPSTGHRITKAGREDDRVALRYEQLVALSSSAQPPRIADELAELADQLELGPLRAAVRQSASVAAVAEGHEKALDVILTRAASEVHSFGAPRTRWLMDVFEAALTLSGKLSSGIDVEGARRSGLRWGIPDVQDNWYVQRWMTAWFSERYDEALAAIDQARTQVTGNLAWRASEALCAAKIGKYQRAQQQADLVKEALPGRAEGPWSTTTAALLAEAAVALRDREAAQLAFDTLVGSTGRSIVLGGGVAYLGPVDRYLGLAMSVVSPDDAVAYLESAVGLHACSDVWTRRAQADLAALCQ